MHEELAGLMFIDGQRCEVLVRSETQEDGTWHNALVFRRDGRMSGKETLVAGVSWHLPPDGALEKAMALEEVEQLELYRRASRPRSHLM